MAETATAHAELAALEQRIVKAKQADREAQNELVRAQRAEEEAKDRVRSAHDVGEPAEKPTRALQKAKEAAEQAGLAREGVQRRVARAERDKAAFTTANAGRLMAELEPEAAAVVAALQQATEDLIAADARWSALQVRVSALLTAQNRRPATDAPGTHELAETVRLLKRSTDAITSPLPYGTRVRAAA